MERFGTNFRTQKKRYEIDEMYEALTSIADEIERFEGSEKVSVNEIKIKFKNVNYKSKLKSKRQIIAKLRRDLKAACGVAKTLEAVKRKETTALTSQLVYARGECVDLLERYNNNIKIIGNLYKQNANQHGKLENLAYFINLGYEELKKIQNEITHEPTTLVQLQKLIESCGQYYADYRNEIEISSQIKQRNRFLKSKIIILENNIDAIKEQLKALEYRNLRLKTENKQLKAKNTISNKGLDFKVAYSEVKMKQSKEVHGMSTDEKPYQDSGDFSQKQAGFDLSYHLDIVNRLLSDQDALLRCLTVITKEISII